MRYPARPLLEQAETNRLTATASDRHGEGGSAHELLLDAAGETVWPTLHGLAAGSREAAGPERLGPVASCAGRVTFALVLAVVMTWPLAARLDRAARLNFGDGEWSLWSVTWVAHALTTTPSRVFQANIFHPDDSVLAYSEANIVTGALGVPFYLATAGNPYATHNGAVLTGLVLSVVFAWGFAAYLGANGPVAAFFAIAFTYCPYLFARTSHIQLMMTFGLPLSLWMFHRLVDAPSVARGAALGVALAVQALACAYFGIFAALMVGLGTVVYALSRQLWAVPRYWLAISTGATVSGSIVAPFFAPYLRVQQDFGFARSLDDAAMFSADWQAWLASSAWAHRWILPWLEQWNEVLFPGVLVSTLGVAGLVVGARRWTAVAQAPCPSNQCGGALTARRRETTLFYGLVGGLALWASFGPAAGLYKVLYASLPVFTFLRAPGRFAIVVVLALGVLALVALQGLLATRSRRAHMAVGTLAAVLVTAESFTAPLTLQDAATPAPHHRQLADLPAGAVIELPFWSARADFSRHARYMLWSTSHWKPLVNGYSDHIPQWFREQAVPLSGFPTRESFALLKPHGVRYALFHLNWYSKDARRALDARIDEFRDHLRPINVTGDVWLFEIVGEPPRDGTDAVALRGLAGSSRLRPRIERLRRPGGGSSPRRAAAEPRA